MTRQEMLKVASQFKIEGAFKMKVAELREALHKAGYSEASMPSVVKPKKPKFDKTLFKADGRVNIDGFQFSPYLLVDNDAIMRGRDGKNILVVDFLKNSAWFKHRFNVVDGPTINTAPLKNRKETSSFYTEKELRDFAANYDIDVTGCKTIEEIYIKVFGGAPLSEG